MNLYIGSAWTSDCLTHARTHTHTPEYIRRIRFISPGQLQLSSTFVFHSSPQSPASLLVLVPRCWHFFYFILQLFCTNPNSCFFLSSCRFLHLPLFAPPHSNLVVPPFFRLWFRWHLPCAAVTAKCRLGRWDIGQPLPLPWPLHTLWLCFLHAGHFSLLLTRNVQLVVR